MPKYTRGFAEEQLAEEIKILEEEENDGVPNNPNQVLTPEEDTFKKRYGDLRRHQQKERDSLTAEITTLKEQINSLSKKEIEYPTSPAQVEAWAKKYPDLYKTIRTIHLQDLKDVNEEVTKVRTEISETKLETQRERAKLELEKRHPDFFTDIDTDQEFHKWLKSKSKRMQDAVYENDTDWESAAEVIDFWKEANKESKRKPQEKYNAKDAAREVSTRRVSVISDPDTYEFKESDIQRMSAAEYAKWETAIDKAHQEGRVVMDMDNKG